MLAPVVVAVLLLRWLPTALAKSCCGEANCNESCPWDHVCSNGRDADCMDRLSGALACRDRSACRTYEACSEAEAARRAGHVCATFPYYNGGFPVAPFRWTKSAETYSCTASSLNGSFCVDWSVASAPDAYETTRGAATCTALSASGSFCAAWTTRTTTRRRCLAADGDDAPICCGPDNADAYDCCERDCDESAYGDALATTRAETCRCDEAAPHGRFCQRWHCEEASSDSRSDFVCTSAAGRAADLSARQANLDVGDWCVAWRRSAERRLSFAVAACRCTGPEAEPCRAWACDEKGGDYVWPNWLWLLLPLLLAAAPLLLATRQFLRGRPLSLLATSSCAPKGSASSRSYRRCWTLLLGFFAVNWLCPLSLIAASRGGLVVVFVVTLPTLAAMAAALLVARARSRRSRRFAACGAAVADDDSVATASCRDSDSSDSDSDGSDSGADGGDVEVADRPRPPQGARAA